MQKRKQKGFLAGVLILLGLSLSVGLTLRGACSERDESSTTLSYNSMFPSCDYLPETYSLDADRDTGEGVPESCERDCMCVFWFIPREYSMFVGTILLVAVVFAFIAYDMTRTRT